MARWISEDGWIILCIATAFDAAGLVCIHEVARLQSCEDDQVMAGAGSRAIKSNGRAVANGSLHGRQE